MWCSWMVLLQWLAFLSLQLLRPIFVSQRFASQSPWFISLLSTCQITLPTRPRTSYKESHRDWHLGSGQFGGLEFGFQRNQCHPFEVILEGNTRKNLISPKVEITILIFGCPSPIFPLSEYWTIELAPNRTGCFLHTKHHPAVSESGLLAGSMANKPWEIPRGTRRFHPETWMPPGSCEKRHRRYQQKLGALFCCFVGVKVSHSSASWCLRQISLKWKRSLT